MAMHGSKDSRKIWGCGIATLLGITAWRYGYYGELLPNTYFAKVGTTKWSQGGLYIGLFFGMYWFLLFEVCCCLLCFAYCLASGFGCVLFVVCFVVICCVLFVVLLLVVW